MRFQPIALCSLFGLLTFAASPAFAQPQGFNYDESKVPTFTLPEPLVWANGENVTDARTWQEKRRPEILKLFEQQVYGCSPQPRDDMSFEVISADKQALGGTFRTSPMSTNFSAA